ncbi:MAG TPA: ABC transporter permease subunit [Patescibacteria group bacterium]|nr:ABC transporter permease subunit [Patescibacteria group bacterium]
MAVKHYHHHYRFSYITSLRRHFTLLLLVVATIVFISIIIIKSLFPESVFDVKQISIIDIVIATINTLIRLTIAYFAALLISVPLALGITKNQTLEKILLPMFDILQSIPVLAFFPIIVIAFVKANFLEGAAIFIIIIAMIGSLVFSMIGGLKTIPEDITNSAKVYGATGLKRLWYVTLPSIFPYIVTGSLLAWSESWSIIIVAEALHTYIPNGLPSDDLFGLGSLLVDSFSQGQNSVFITSLSTLIIVITLFNYFVWQKLLHVAERFRFD